MKKYADDKVEAEVGDRDQAIADSAENIKMTNQQEIDQWDEDLHKDIAYAKEHTVAETKTYMDGKVDSEEATRNSVIIA